MDHPRYTETTDGIKVTVRPTFLDEQSDPSEGSFVWAYQIEIENLGRETVQLVTRHWRITDALGRCQEVRGPGVVGQQPVLKPGTRFTYTSGAPLPTPSGFMVGSFQMRTEGGRGFDAQVPAFSLDSPHQATGRLN